jgi:hypothetical protein
VTAPLERVVAHVRRITGVASVVVAVDTVAGDDLDEAEAAVRALAAGGEAVLFAAPLTPRWPAWWDDLFARSGLVPVDVVRPFTWDDETVPSVVRETGVLYVRPEVAAAVAAAPVDRSAVHPISLVRAADALASATARAVELEATVDDLAARFRHARLEAADRRAEVAAARPAPAPLSLEPLAHELDARAAVARAAADRAAAAAGRQALDGPAPSAAVVARARAPLPALARWASGRRPRPPVFDEGWYLRQCPDVLGGRLAPASHYRRHGARAGLSPHPLFDPAWYRSQAPGLGAGDDPVEHYLDTGADAGLDPHPVFATRWYAETHAVPAGTNPLVDYLARWRDGASPHPLFDAPWYRRRHPGVDGEPLAHFLRLGWLEGHDPRPSFDVRWYLFHSADVAAEGTNPLVHYLVHGWRQGRDPHRLFEVRWYLARHRDVADAGVEPLGFYLQHGAARGDDPGGIFETAWYRDRHPGAANPLEHYIEHGAAAGEPPSRWAAALHAGLPFLSDGG